LGILVTCQGMSQHSTPILPDLDVMTLEEGGALEFAVTANDADIDLKIQNPTIVAMGSSTAEGQKASPGNDWVSLLRDYLDDNALNGTVVRLAKGGYKSYHFRETGYTPPQGRPSPDPNYNITKALSYNPDLVIVNLPSNDVASAYDRQETYDNFQAFKDEAHANASLIFFHTTQPRNFTGTFGDARRLELFEKAGDILDIFAPDTVNTYHPLADLTDYTIKDAYNADNIHVNDEGHAIIYERTLDAIEHLLVGDSITYDLINPPSFITSETVGNELNLSVNPGYEDAGIYELIISATDLDGNTDTGTLTIEVQDRDPLAGSQVLNSFTHTVNSGGTADYYIYYPTNYSQSVPFPVLVSLHGLGEVSDDPSDVLGEKGEGSIAKLAAEGGQFPLIVVSPHRRDWVGGEYEDLWNIELLEQLRNHLLSQYDIDETKFYLTGFSQGATAVWQYAVNNPDHVAAMVALAGRTDLTGLSPGINLQEPQYACQITDIPTRVWHGSNDFTVPTINSVNMVNAVDGCTPAPDPTVELNIVEDMSHDEALRTLVYSDVSSPQNIYDWMLQYDNSAVLPVEWVLFEGKVHAGEVILIWKTASELNNHGFYVERLEDGVFEKKGFVAGRGTTSESSNYQFNDVWNTSTGEQYYRLRQVDFDGRFALSPVISVNFDQSKDQPSVYPSLVTERISINGDTESYRFHLYDVAGRVIHEKPDLLGLRQIERILNQKIKSIPPSEYFLTLTSHQHQYKYRFIVK